MADRGGTDVLLRARVASLRGDWTVAFDAFCHADAAGAVGPADLGEFAGVAYAAGQLDVAIATWERAHAAAIAADDPAGAAGAATRVAMHLLFDTALMAPVRGWLARASRLLEGLDDTPVHAWFGVVQAYERMLAGDLDGARPWARLAAELGSRVDAAAGTIGQVAVARLAILDGDVTAGLAGLDDAGVTVLAGDLDPLSTGVVYCELVCALQGLAQYDLAAEWTEAMERWCRTNAIGSLHGRCRVHRAEILRLRGALDEAESEVLAAYDELRPYLRRELGWPLRELGQIRLRRGDLSGAEAAFEAAHHAGWDPQPGLALVQLSSGDADGAATSIRDALDHPRGVPSKERPPASSLLRAPLLDAEVEIALAVGDVFRARKAAAELAEIADRFGSTALRAGSLAGLGQVLCAEGDAIGAGAVLARAVDLWTEVGAPWEAARARVAFAHALDAAGRHELSAHEEAAAQTALDRLARPVTDPSLSGPPIRWGSDDVGAAAVFRREGDYWAIAFDGTTVRIHDRKGLRHLARLLAEPGREFHVLDLVAAEAGVTPSTPVAADDDLSVGRAGDAGEVLDTQAKAAYKRRLDEIDADIADAEAVGDVERAAQADAEREFLIGELSRAFGLGGRGRRAGSASERARVAVTRALRTGLERVAEHHPSLGAHLDHAIRTGTYCSYEPDPRSPVHWQT